MPFQIPKRILLILNNPVILSTLSLHIQVANLQRVRLDELPPRLDLVAHQDREDLVGLDDVVHPHLQQHPLVRVHRRLPELIGVHLAETLVPLDVDVLLRRREDVVEQAVRDESVTADGPSPTVNGAVCRSGMSR